jgi:F-box/leucine-rich repeat protein 2/20
VRFTTNAPSVQVCKAWSTLIYDGQLWSELDLRAFPKISASQLMHIVESAGSFITSFDLSGHRSLLPSTLESLTSSLAVVHGMRVGPPHNQLTYINMSGSVVTTPSLHSLLTQSPFLETSILKGMPAITNETCEILSKHCPRLVSLDLSRCKNLTGAGIRSFVSSAVTRAKLLPLIELRLSGLKGITDSMMSALGKAAPHLEVLDLSYCRDLHNSSLDAFVACSEDFTMDSISLTARQAGRNSNDGGRYRRRITRLRHLSLSSCTLLTDIACSHLAYCMPQLEFLELGRVGGELKDDGVVRLLETLPNLRKLDLEDAIEITDKILRAITPHPSSDDTKRDMRRPGHALEHLIVSSAAQVTNDAFLDLIRNCTRLRVLEADSTRISAAAVKEFVKLARERNAQDAIMVAIDCRSMNESVKELADSTRPRLGWRAYEARRMAYLDGRDDEALGVGQDECDPQRVVLKTFASWQTVDAVAAARSKRRKGWRRRDANPSSGSSAIEDAFPQRSRWWSPGGRRSSGMNSPSLLETNSEREGCTIM